jgi:proteic killer suppression protein
MEVTQWSNLVIASFGDQTTEDLFHGRQTSRVRRYPQEIIERAMRKLDMLNAAHQLEDLRYPPANYLESLRGDLAGQHSVRVNQQWRIIFRWSGRDAHQVILIDYH